MASTLLTLALVLLFIGAMAALAWFARRQRHGAGGAACGAAPRLLSAVAVGPQQRVVTLEIGHGPARTWLVLGVTARQINCLHVLPAAPQEPADD